MSANRNRADFDRPPGTNHATWGTRGTMSTNRNRADYDRSPVTNHAQPNKKNKIWLSGTNQTDGEHVGVWQPIRKKNAEYDHPAPTKQFRERGIMWINKKNSEYDCAAPIKPFENEGSCESIGKRRIWPSGTDQTVRERGIMWINKKRRIWPSGTDQTVRERGIMWINKKRRIWLCGIEHKSGLYG